MDKENILPRILILMVLILLVFLISMVNKEPLKEGENKDNCLSAGYYWDVQKEKCVRGNARTYCEEIKEGNCYELYKPVCGWFNINKVRCVQYPCAETFSNGCFACLNNNVAYYEEGVCPV